jgi:hypothetical protein
MSNQLINLNDLQTTLSIRNAHPRDKNIVFYEENHTYKVLSDEESTYTSVTTWIHTFFSHFDADKIIAGIMKSRGWREGHKYWGKTTEEIKNLWEVNRVEAASLGTKLHYNIECFMNSIICNPNSYSNADLLDNYLPQINSLDEVDQSKEWSYFIDFITAYPDLKPYRTEWFVYHEDIKIAGSIDMVYENSDGTLSIYDWKRAKSIAGSEENSFHKFSKKFGPVSDTIKLPDTNYWHYALQLNIYKKILEDKYSVVIKELFLVRLHPDASGFELIKLPDLSKEVSYLFMERM